MSTSDKNFVIDAISVNNCSFYAQVPLYRLEKNWQPSAHLDLDVKHRELGSNIFEVDVVIDVKVTIDSENIFAVHVVQTGTFSITGYNAQETESLLEIICPTILYPYAREKLAYLVAGGGFPPLHLSPVDFESRFRSLQEELQEDDGEV